MLARRVLGPEDRLARGREGMAHDGGVGTVAFEDGRLGSGHGAILPRPPVSRCQFFAVGSGIPSGCATGGPGVRALAFVAWQQRT
ncbi:hypothetical protein LLS1_23190 [Leifsonia sp. LS1]|nr:hypothetical protein LLS1_23190 [Leifsonia sp. LS1]